METTYEAFLNGYPQEAIEFFDTFDKYLNNELDENGFKTASLENFAIFDEAEEGLSNKIYEKYLRSVKQITEYLAKGYKL